MVVKTADGHHKDLALCAQGGTGCNQLGHHLQLRGQIIGADVSKIDGASKVFQCACHDAFGVDGAFANARVFILHDVLRIGRQNTV